MAILGLMTRKESQKLIDQQVKVAMEKLPQWLNDTAGAETYNLPDPSKYAYQADTYRKLSWVLAAVQHVASEAALAAGQVMTRKGEESEGVKNHPFELLLQKPNPLDSHYEFIYSTVAMKKLTGNAYWWLNKRNENAAPDEMWVIPSHMIRPIPDEKLYLKGYMYNPGFGAEIPMEPWEIVHFKSFNPFSRFVGLSAIESLAMNIAATYGMEESIKKYYVDGGGRAPAILMFADMIGDEQWKKIQNEARMSAKEKQLMMLRGVGSGSVNLLQNSVSQKDQDLLGQMTANRNEIFTVLAPGLASMLDVNATEANAIAGRATFKERAVYPELVTIAEKITTSIMDDYGDNLYYEYDDIRWADRQMELAEMTQYSLTHTVEEVRTKYYNDKPLGDERDQLLPAQVQPDDGRPEPEIEEPMVEPMVENSPMVEEEEPEPMGTELSPDQVGALVELDRWEEKSLKAGKITRWHCVNLAKNVHDAISEGIMTWEQARETVKDKGIEYTEPTITPAPDYSQLIEAMRLEVGFIKSQQTAQPMSLTIHNHPGEAPIVNIEQAAQKAEQPIVNVTVEPTPVTVKNEIKADKNLPDETNQVLKAIRKLANEK